MMALSFLINMGSLFITSLLSALSGLGLNAYFPIACQAYTEKCYPAAELVLMVLIMIFANLFGLVGNILTAIPSMKLLMRP